MNLSVLLLLHLWGPVILPPILVSRLVETFDVFMPFPGEDCSLAFFEGMSVSVLHNSSQTDLQAILDDSLFKQLVSSSTIRDQESLRALSHSSGTSSGWLKALPQPVLGLAIPPHDFTIALRLWLGIQFLCSLLYHSVLVYLSLTSLVIICWGALMVP